MVSDHQYQLLLAWSLLRLLAVDWLVTHSVNFVQEHFQMTSAVTYLMLVSVYDWYYSHSLRECAVHLKNWTVQMVMYCAQLQELVS